MPNKQKQPINSSAAPAANSEEIKTQYQKLCQELELTIANKRIEISEQEQVRFFSLGQYLAYTECIQKGVKPVACMSVANTMLGEIVTMIGQDGLHHIIKENGVDHQLVYIYKYLHLEESILVLDTPVKNYHWQAGKLFGYSEECIAEYICRGLNTGSGINA